MPPTTAEQQAAAAKKYNLLYAGSFFMVIAQKIFLSFSMKFRTRIMIFRQNLVQKYFLDDFFVKF